MVEILRRIFRRERRETLEGEEMKKLRETLGRHGLPNLDLASLDKEGASYIRGLLESIEEQHGLTMRELVERAKEASRKTNVDPSLVETLENWENIVKTYHAQGKLDEAITGINQAALQVLAIYEAERRGLPRGDVIKLFSELGYRKALEKLEEIEKKIAK